MERTQSLENLSKVNHDLRNTVGRKARRAAQAAAPLPIPTRMTLPNPTKLPENLPPFSPFDPSSSSAVSTAVGVPTQSTSRILTLQQSTSHSLHCSSTEQCISRTESSRISAPSKNPNFSFCCGCWSV